MRLAIFVLCEVYLKKKGVKSLLHGEILLFGINIQCFRGQIALWCKDCVISRCN